MGDDLPDEVGHKSFTFSFRSQLIMYREHMFRNHSNTFQCQRCERGFHSQEALQTHCKARRGCEAAEHDHNDGMTAAQAMKLKDRKRVGDDKEKWYDIYKMLFGEDDLPESPCKPYFQMT